MNKSFFIFAIFFLSFIGCENGDETQILSNPPKRTITQDDIGLLKYATVCGFPEVGWNILKLTPIEKYDPQGESLSFFIDIDANGILKEGSFKCMNTESFKKFAGFKCNNVDYEPNDIIQITKNSENNYTITFSYIEDDQSFQGTFTGTINYLWFSIDFHQDCY